MSQQLEERFMGFAGKVRDFCSQLDFNVINKPYISQLVRASSSIGANYIEASDSLGENDEKMILRISRREAKESVYWLNLLLINKAHLEEEKILLIYEAVQIKKILSAIIAKLETPKSFNS